MSVNRMLSRKKVINDFRPAGNTGEGQKEIRPTLLSNIGEFVLCVLMHVPWATSH